MSDMEPRRRARPSRRRRSERAYSLVLVTGGLAVLTIALVILAVLGVVGGGWAFLAAILTAGGGLVLRRTLNP
jgi:small-conductance mechanosensitive channel